MSAVIPASYRIFRSWPKSPACQNPAPQRPGCCLLVAPKVSQKLEGQFRHRYLGRIIAETFSQGFNVDFIHFPISHDRLEVNRISVDGQIEYFPCGAGDTILQVLEYGWANIGPADVFSFKLGYFSGLPEPGRLREYITKAIKIPGSLEGHFTCDLKLDLVTSLVEGQVLIDGKDETAAGSRSSKSAQFGLDAAARRALTERLACRYLNIPPTRSRRNRAVKVFSSPQDVSPDLDWAERERLIGSPDGLVFKYIGCEWFMSGGNDSVSVQLEYVGRANPDDALDEPAANFRLQILKNLFSKMKLYLGGHIQAALGKRTLAYSYSQEGPNFIYTVAIKKRAEQE